MQKRGDDYISWDKTIFSTLTSLFPKKEILQNNFVIALHIFNYIGRFIHSTLTLTQIKNKQNKI